MCREPSFDCPFELPLWTWCEGKCISLELNSALPSDFLAGEVLFTSSGKIRLWKIQERHFPWAGNSRKVFPFDTITASDNDEQVDTQSHPLLGRSYHVEFWPQPFQVYPLGTFLLDPLTRSCCRSCMRLVARLFGYSCM